MATKTLQKGRYDICLHKAICDPAFGAKTVLSADPWSYVELWLQRKKKHEAKFYWQQARNFAHAASDLPEISAPVPIYYCFLNAAKALLSAKSINFNPYHGLSGGHIEGRIIPEHETTKLKNAGVLPSLSGYFGETEQRKKYNLKELLFNVTFVHRAYCLSYPQQTEMFIPLTKPRYILDDVDREIWLAFDLVGKYSDGRTLRTLPNNLFTAQAGETPQETKVESNTRVQWFNQRDDLAAKSRAFDQLKADHKKLRLDLTYIRGPQRIWYLKRRIAGPDIINRYSPTITMMAMHRLSELARYQPLRLSKLLSGPQNWLLSEFINSAPIQFVDEIASEITGFEFMVPGIRA